MNEEKKLSCFERADAIHALDAATRAIEITDRDSLCAYMKGFLELIYTYKMYGYVYDIYADGCCRTTSNGREYKGIPAIEHEIMKLCAAFPNLSIEIGDMIAAKDGADGYKLWVRCYFHGDNTAASIYGPPTGGKLEGDKALCHDVFYIRKIDGEWLIVKEGIHLPEDYIRGICTGDFSFTTTVLP